MINNVILTVTDVNRYIKTFPICLTIAFRKIGKVLFLKEVNCYHGFIIYGVFENGCIRRGMYFSFVLLKAYITVIFFMLLLSTQ